MKPAYIVASKLQRHLQALDVLTLSWIDLEAYEGMHNLVAAVFQSLPTIILNSILFASGNKPSHGIYLSNALFLAAIVASCLAILKCLAANLWQAFKAEVNPVRHAVNVMTGKAILGKENELVVLDRAASNIELLTQQYLVSGSAPLGSPGQTPT